MHAISIELANVLEEVDAERQRQDEKWGEQNHVPVEWIAVLGEEFGEVCQDALKYHFGDKELLGDKYLRQYRQELIQVAAVAVAMVECLDRRKWEGTNGSTGG